MAELSYDLYDTAVFGAVAATEHTLFQVGQGADATHTKSFTNARGAGYLPEKESFRIDRIYVSPDHALVEADIESIWRASYLEIRVSDELLLQSPLKMFAAYGGYGGHFAQAAAANRVLIGLQGMGRIIEPSILIPGGTQFKIVVFQSVAVTAGSNMKIILSGLLTKPD